MIKGKAREKLLKSKFFKEVIDIATMWNFYTDIKDYERARELDPAWDIAKWALKHITGDYYVNIRCSDGSFSIRNTKDLDDALYIGVSQQD